MDAGCDVIVLNTVFNMCVRDEGMEFHQRCTSAEVKKKRSAVKIRCNGAISQGCQRERYLDNFHTPYIPCL